MANNIVGTDAQGQTVRIGDVVNHTVKGFTSGTVLSGGESYKGEKACLVDYSSTGGPSSWLNRLSRMTLAAAPKKSYTIVIPSFTIEVRG